MVPNMFLMGVWVQLPDVMIVDLRSARHISLKAFQGGVTLQELPRKDLFENGWQANYTCNVLVQGTAKSQQQLSKCCGHFIWNLCM